MPALTLAVGLWPALPVAHAGPLAPLPVAQALDEHDHGDWDVDVSPLSNLAAPALMAGVALVYLGAMRWRDKRRIRRAGLGAD